MPKLLLLTLGILFLVFAVVGLALTFLGEFFSLPRVQPPAPLEELTGRVFGSVGAVSRLILFLTVFVVPGALGGILVYYSLKNPMDVDW